MKKKLNGETAAAVGVLGCAGIAILIKLALLVGIVYVAVHFISKYW